MSRFSAFILRNTGSAIFHKNKNSGELVSETGNLNIHKRSDVVNRSKHKSHGRPKNKRLL